MFYKALFSLVNSFTGIFREFVVCFLETRITGVENSKTSLFQNISDWVFLKRPFHIFRCQNTVKTIFIKIFLKNNF